MAKLTRYYKSERLDFLSDGVFAIVLTLLVLELRLPPSDDDPNQVWKALIENSHELVGWIVSFVVLARMWIIHHDTLSSVKRVSSRTILVNFVFLATISLVPFAAKLIGEYEFSDPDAIIVFSAMLGLCGLTLGWVISSAERDAHLNQPVRTKWSWRVRHHLLFLPILAVLAILTAFLHPAIGLLILGVEALAAIILLVTTGSDDELDSDVIVVEEED